MTKPQPLRDTKILLGVTGGIAVYKSAELCRMLQRAGAQVRVVMSEAACRFVTPLTFETLTGHPVGIHMFGDTGGTGGTGGVISHIELAKFADILVVAPATADYMARCAQGRANDLLAAVTLAHEGPIIFAPAMNTGMWRNFATERNVSDLVENHGWHMVPPGEGHLACGDQGPGRLAELGDILDAVCAVRRPKLMGKKVVITAGPTAEDIDPVRSITNRSSGIMGCELARMALYHAALEVTVILGPCPAEPPWGSRVIPIRSAREMQVAVNAEAETADVVIMAAAVSDWRPATIPPEKLKRADGTIPLPLVPNPDILGELGARMAGRDRPILVGFALETDNLLDSAQDKLKRKQVHIMVGNMARDALESATTEAVILEDNGAVWESGRVTKTELADAIIDRISRRFAQS